jgi:hypothetical protein
LEWVDPVHGASDLVPPEHQPADSGDADLAVMYTERCAAVVADWWAPLRA